MNYKTTIALLSIVALFVLGFAAVRFGWISDPAPQNPEQQSLVLSPDQWKPDKVTKITIKRPNHPDAILRRLPGAQANGKEWQQVEPVNWALNDGAMNRLLLHAGQLQRRSESETNPPATEVELSPANITITFGGNQPPQTIALGKAADLGFYWASINGGPPVTVTDELHDFFSKYQVRQLRDPYITGLGREDTNVIRFSQLNQAGELTRIQRNLWDITSPKSPANITKINQLRSRLANIQLGLFITDIQDQSELATYGLDKPGITIEVQTGEAHKAQLLIGSSVDQTQRNFYAKLSDNNAVFTLSNQIVSDLSLQADDFRSQNPIGLQPEDLLNIQLKFDNILDVGFTKEGNVWAFTNQQIQYAPNLESLAKVLQLLFKVKPVSYSTVAPDRKASGTITLKSLDGKSQSMHYDRTEDQHIILWPADPNIGNTAYHYKLEQAGILIAQNLAFRDTQLLDLNANQINSITLTRLETNKATYTIKPMIELQQPRLGFPGDQPDKIQLFLNALLKLRASRWSSDKALSADVSIQLNTQQGVRTLMVDTYKKKGIFLDEQGKAIPPAFELPEAFTKTLNSELRDPVMLKIASTQIESIQRNEVTLKQDATGRPVLEGAGDKPLNMQNISAMFTTVMGLNAMYILDHQKAPESPAQWNFIVTTKAGRQVNLKIWRENAKGYSGAIAQIDDGPVFSLSSSSYQQLTGSLTQE